MHHLQLDNMPSDEKREIVEWLEQKDRETEHLESIRFRLTMIGAVLAALGVWVAAWLGSTAKTLIGVNVRASESGSPVNVHIC